VFRLGHGQRLSAVVEVSTHYTTADIVLGVDCGVCDAVFRLGDGHHLSVVVEVSTHYTTADRVVG